MSLEAIIWLTTLGFLNPESVYLGGPPHAWDFLPSLLMELSREREREVIDMKNR